PSGVRRHAPGRCRDVFVVLLVARPRKAAAEPARMSTLTSPSDDGNHSREPRAHRAVPLRAHFLRIGLAAFVPLLVFSAALVVLLAREARDTFQRGASERTLAILTAVDTELKRAVAALEALATSRRLTPAEWVGFREEADGVLGSREEWLTIHLALPSGLEVLDLLALPELTLHHVVDKDTFDDVVRHRRPAVGNLIREPITGSHAFPVRVPVLRDEEVVYVLTALVKPAVTAGLLSPEELPRSEERRVGERWLHS